MPLFSRPKTVQRDVSLKTDSEDPRSHPLEARGQFLDGDSKFGKRPGGHAYRESSDRWDRDYQMWALALDQLAKSFRKGLVCLEKTPLVSELRETISEIGRVSGEPYSCTVLAVRDESRWNDGRRLLLLDKDGFYLAESGTLSLGSGKTGVLNERNRLEVPMTRYQVLSHRVSSKDLVPFMEHGADFGHVTEVLAALIGAKPELSGVDPDLHKRELLGELSVLDLAKDLFPKS